MRSMRILCIERLPMPLGGDDHEDFGSTDRSFGSGLTRRAFSLGLNAQRLVAYYSHVLSFHMCMLCTPFSMVYMRENADLMSEETLLAERARVVYEAQG